VPSPQFEDETVLVETCLHPVNLLPPSEAEQVQKGGGRKKESESEREKEREKRERRESKRKKKDNNCIFWG